MKDELLKCLDELQGNIYEIEEIGWKEYKESEDYDRADVVRLQAELNLSILKKAIEKYVKD